MLLIKVLGFVAGVADLADPGPRAFGFGAGFGVGMPLPGEDGYEEAMKNQKMEGGMEGVRDYAPNPGGLRLMGRAWSCTFELATEMMSADQSIDDHTSQQSWVTILSNSDANSSVNSVAVDFEVGEEGAEKIDFEEGEEDVEKIDFEVGGPQKHDDEEPTAKKLSDLEEQTAKKISDLEEQTAKKLSDLEEQTAKKLSDLEEQTAKKLSPTAKKHQSDVEKSTSKSLSSSSYCEGDVEILLHGKRWRVTPWMAAAVVEANVPWPPSDTHPLAPTVGPLAPVALATGRAAAELLNTAVMRSRVLWLMGAPAGLKLHRHVGRVLGGAALWGIEVSDAAAALARPFDRSMLVVLSLLSMFGASLPIAAAADLWTVSTLHSFLLYRLFAFLHKYQLLALSSLALLLRGRKHNVLRHRVDSAPPGVSRLLIGSMFFTAAAFLFPTPTVYYIFFSIVRLLVLAAGAILSGALSAITEFPIAAIVLRFLYPDSLPAGLSIHPLPPPPPSPVFPQPSASRLRSTPAPIISLFTPITQSISNLTSFYNPINIFQSFVQGLEIPPPPLQDPAIQTPHETSANTSQASHRFIEDVSALILE